jgi:hypothetical protein
MTRTPYRSEGSCTPLYRVIHRSRTGQCGHDNRVVASNPIEAVEIRAAQLGIADDEDYEVTVEQVPDPDGSEVRRWLHLWGN